MCTDKIAPVDVEENNIIELQPEILAGLLKDCSTGKNIIWATDDYSYLGENYQFSSEIVPEAITGENGNIIMPRAVKSKLAQSSRTRNMAEVFTPTWICNKMNNLVDEAWFGRSNVFNEENGNQWAVCEGKVAFPDYYQYQPKGWESYIAAKRLEITCGEAPYLVSRYDTVTGEAIPVENRVGILDRKFRIINERTKMLKDREKAHKRWLELAKKALQSTYGFEWQGDNVLLARENLLYTVMDYFFAKFGEQMPQEWLPDLVEIISWNIWQMDGLKCVVPNSCHDYKKQPKPVEPNLFDAKAYSASVLKRSVGFCDVDENEIQKCQGCLKDNVDLHNGVYCKIKNWSTGRVVEFKDLMSVQGSEERMSKDFKFDVVIGNPPYQEEIKNTSDKPIYNYFMDASYMLSDIVLLITPARFLFDAGKTPKVWNQKMLADPNLSVLYYEPNSVKVFPNTDIKGGVAITYHDCSKDYGAIGHFTPYNELNSIWNKVKHSKDFVSLCEIIITSFAYHYTDKLHEDYPEAASLLSKGHAYDIKSNAFDRLPQVFYDEEPNDGRQYIRVLGRQNNDRAYKFIRREYVNNVSNLDKYKLFIPKANGTGAFGELLTLPEICEPNVGATESFVSIGLFDSILEVNNCFKYVKTKFLRALLGIVKITQDLTPSKWKCIPLQDFTDKSDIDWSSSISKIDQQLYRKYGLSEEEINFIETKVKPMD